ncbi:MAG: hypothetical protein ACI9U2_004908 [Bradymonadia bacterium]|jgi:hypothetical protein
MVWGQSSLFGLPRMGAPRMGAPRMGAGGGGLPRMGAGGGGLPRMGGGGGGGGALGFGFALGATGRRLTVGAGLRLIRGKSPPVFLIVGLRGPGASGLAAARCRTGTGGSEAWRRRPTGALVGGGEVLGAVGLGAVFLGAVGLGAVFLGAIEAPRMGAKLGRGDPSGALEAPRMGAKLGRGAASGALDAPRIGARLGALAGAPLGARLGADRGARLRGAEPRGATLRGDASGDLDAPRIDMPSEARKSLASSATALAFAFAFASRFGSILALSRFLTASRKSARLTSRSKVPFSIWRRMRFQYCSNTISR